MYINFLSNLIKIGFNIQIFARQKPLKTSSKSLRKMVDGILAKIWGLYFKRYKIYLFIPFILAILAIIQLIAQTQTTGDFINKDISLKGGVTLTILTDSQIDLNEIESLLKPEFSPYSISIRTLKGTGKQIGFLIESDIPNVDKNKLDTILNKLGEKFGKKLTQQDYSLDILGSSLGISFYKQTVNAMLVAFVFMAIVVFIYFRSFAPSIAVITCVFSDIVTTMAVVNLLGIKVGTAGIAAYLMLIGYSVDTDMLLTTRVLRRKDESPRQAVISAFKTGILMTSTTLAALLVGLIFTKSEVIHQIMIIILIGLVIDVINTWVQNSGIILWYVERKQNGK